MQTIRRTLLLSLLLLGAVPISAQRFMRRGFTNNEDFGAEMKLDDKDSAVDMTREMFLMKEMEFEIQPIDELNVRDPAVRKQIQKYLSRPVEMKLFKKRGKYGLRAMGRTENGKKLRAFWRQASPNALPRLVTADYLTASYDDAVRSRLFTVEFELQLPPVSKKNKALPSVVYQFSVEGKWGKCQQRHRFAPLCHWKVHIFCAQLLTFHIFPPSSSRQHESQIARAAGPGARLGLSRGPEFSG